ncbi:LytS family sensor histidine kinase [Sphingobacterium litopenaei]|uniref:Histidine kinase n=1 Tax=Sphingobacterium litopenaei TaxID=2763500 RepID=A0ABR7YB31_9SPHI|nr:hypothetical protein [Sphingobacterium litopenaei]MBD1428497.1 hypothetical protein [Sphingobacterium litopenaei]
MKNARIRVLMHLIIAAFIFLWNYFLNYFYAQEEIPLLHIIAISSVYILFYLAISIFLEILFKNPNLIRAIVFLSYLIFAWNITWIIQEIIYSILPEIGIVLFNSNVPRNDTLFHYRIWDAFISLHIIALIYYVILRFVMYYLETKNLQKELAIKRERAEDMKYTSHFMKNIFSESFGQILLNNEPKDTRTKMDIIEFLGYILELEELGKKDSWGYSLDKLQCFIRLLRAHYGTESVVFNLINDGREINQLPRGLLLFPLENCLKHAYISPDYPINYKLIKENCTIEIECTSTTNHLKIKEKSGNGFLFLKEKINSSDYLHIMENTSNLKDYTLYLKLTPKYDAKTKIQYSSLG